MTLFRKKHVPRKPHPDSRVEAELQRVLGLQRTAERIEKRLADITCGQRALDKDRRKGAALRAGNMAKQSVELRAERTDLEAQLAPLHDEVAKRLAELGNDALYL